MFVRQDSGHSALTGAQPRTSEDTRIVDLCENVPYNDFMPLDSALSNAVVVRVGHNLEHPHQPWMRVLFAEQLDKGPGIVIPFGIIITELTTRYVPNLLYAPSRTRVHMSTVDAWMHGAWNRSSWTTFC